MGTESRGADRWYPKCQSWCRMGDSHFGCVLFLTALPVVPAPTRLWLGGQDNRGYGLRRSHCGWTLVQKDLNQTAGACQHLRTCSCPQPRGEGRASSQMWPRGQREPCRGEMVENRSLETEERAQGQRERLSEGRMVACPWRGLGT